MRSLMTLGLVAGLVAPTWQIVPEKKAYNRSSPRHLGEINVKQFSELVNDNSKLTCSYVTSTYVLQLGLGPSPKDDTTVALPRF